jgi:hypothetical protein
LVEASAEKPNVWASPAASVAVEARHDPADCVHVLRHDFLVGDPDLEGGFEKRH